MVFPKTNIPFNRLSAAKASTNIKADTSNIVNLVQNVINLLDAEDLERLSIAHDGRSEASNFILRRYLENTATYAETILPDSPGMSPLEPTIDMPQWEGVSEPDNAEEMTPGAPKYAIIPSLMSGLINA
jgi:carbohydrate-binding DOMON domain-containing protein